MPQSRAVKAPVTECELGGNEDGRPEGRPSSNRGGSPQAEKLLPHPHPPVALGFLKVKPEPCIDVT